MKNKRVTGLIACLLSLLFLAGAVPVTAANHLSAVDEAQSLIDGIVAYELQQSGASTVQQWIDSSLTKNAGATSEWYILALSQSGTYNFSSYQTALLRYLSEHEVYAAVSRQKYALALIATGSTDGYITRTLNDSIGQQGIMSWIYGLHLLNNGYSSQDYSTATVKQKLISLQLADGGWAVTGKTGDVDVTAMAVQALTPYYDTDPSVKAAVHRALNLLSARQLSSGDYASYGVSNPESTAQVMVALSGLGINGETDARFIKNGHTLLDGLKRYRLSDGSFCHQQGGATNGTATVQAFYALVAYRRMANGQSGLYMLDGRRPIGETGLSTTSSSPATRPSVTQGSGARTSAGKTETVHAAVVGTNRSILPSATDSGGTSPTGAADTTGRQTGMTLASASRGSVLSSAAAPHKDVYTDGTSSFTVSYKVWVCLGLLLVGGGGCLVLYVTKKRSAKQFVTIIALTAAAIGVVCGVNIQSVEDFYGQSSSVQDDIIGTVTLTIRCDTLVGKSDAAHVPADGVILATSIFDLHTGDTVFDVLTQAVRQNRIALESTGAGEGVYIEGIQQIYAFDFGDLSGWMYTVNGSVPSVGCGEYRLSDGDAIEWQYTCDLGQDIGYTSDNA